MYKFYLPEKIYNECIFIMNVASLSLEESFKRDANDNLFNGCVQKQKLPSLH